MQPRIVHLPKADTHRLQVSGAHITQKIPFLGWQVQPLALSIQMHDISLCRDGSTDFKTAVPLKGKLKFEVEQDSSMCKCGCHPLPSQAFLKRCADLTSSARAQCSTSASAPTKCALHAGQHVTRVSQPIYSKGPRAGCLRPCKSLVGVNLGQSFSTARMYTNKFGQRQFVHAL